MSEKDILEEAIQKAIDGGWWPFAPLDGRYKEKTKPEMFKRFYEVEYDGIRSKSQWDHDCLECYDPAYPINDFIFDHDFAKALWGEELHHKTFIVPKELSTRFAGTRDLDIKPIWQYHLQQMVIAEDPIKYLSENI